MERVLIVPGLRHARRRSKVFDRANPRSPVNRRISIVVMTRKAEEDAQRIDVLTPASADPAPAPGPEVLPG